MTIEYLYRDVSIPRMSKDACANFVHALAISGATVISNFSLSNGFTERQISYQSIFFKVRFLSQSQLDKFHSLGIKTSEPEKVSGQDTK